MGVVSNIQHPTPNALCPMLAYPGGLLRCGDERQLRFHRDRRWQRGLWGRGGGGTTWVARAVGGRRTRSRGAVYSARVHAEQDAAGVGASGAGDSRGGGV